MKKTCWLTLLPFLWSCSSPFVSSDEGTSDQEETDIGEESGSVGDESDALGNEVSLEVLSDDAWSNFDEVLGRSIDLDDLPNYVNQSVPDYIVADNGGPGASDELAVLGRVLFYDKALSSNDSTSCASCHQQAFAFGDPARFSAGAFGETGRHSMRLEPILKTN